MPFMAGRQTNFDIVTSAYWNNSICAISSCGVAQYKSNNCLIAVSVPVKSKQANIGRDI